jgi:L-iditol 2-dehydrogenase
MKALVLEDVGQFQISEVPTPSPKHDEVLIRVLAVGICGTDLHIFRGLANYHRDARGRPISLKSSPQILGHEMSGTVESVGSQVRRCQPGDRVIVDQVLNCISQHRTPICEYCESGDSHQCQMGQELGITGIPGAFADYVVVPEANVVILPADISPVQGALVEPLGCVLHAMDRVTLARNRYEFEGRRRIRQILILGAGPSGLLFLQYIRSIARFDGEIFVADMRDEKLALVSRLGGVPLDLRRLDLISEISKRTHGEGVQFLIEATGSGEVLDWIRAATRPQATVLLYGAGHSGRDVACLTPLQASEINIVTTAGASGGFDPDGTPTTYRRSMELVRDKRVNVECLVSHQYGELADLVNGFAKDFQLDNFIKGALVVETS